MLIEVGIFLRQWDGQEENGTPWKMCLHQCRCEGLQLNGRISAMVIYQGLRNRSDRIAISLPFLDRGGIIMHPSHITVDCLYGNDIVSRSLDDPSRPGCSDKFCDVRQENEPSGLCGFNGSSATAWAPKDMKHLLQLHLQHGGRYQPPGVVAASLAHLIAFCGTPSKSCVTLPQPLMSF